MYIFLVVVNGFVHGCVCVFLTVFGGLCSFSLCLLETFFQFCSVFLVLIWVFCSLLFAVEPRVVFHVWFCFGSSVLYLFGLLYFFWFLRNFRSKQNILKKLGNPNIKVKKYTIQQRKFKMLTRQNPQSCGKTEH